MRLETAYLPYHYSVMTDPRSGPEPCLLVLQPTSLSLEYASRIPAVRTRVEEGRYHTICMLLAGSGRNEVKAFPDQLIYPVPPTLKASK